MLASALLVAGVSCASPGGGRDDRVAVDVADTLGANSMTISAPGPLRSRLGDGRACFWFVAVDGTEVSIVWPAGSTARSEPLRVLDGDGEVIASSGDVGLSFSGSFSEGRAGCSGPASQVFVAGSVTKPA